MKDYRKETLFKSETDLFLVSKLSLLFRTLAGQKINERLENL